jgi:lysophospholipase L1-like esterase
VHETAGHGFLGRVAPNLVLTASSLAVALLVGEALVRLLSPIGPALLVTDRVVGRRFLPGYEGRVFVDEAGRKVAVRINSDGFPGPEWPRRRTADGLRVAVIGDSMTAAIATDEERRFVRRLQDALQADAPSRPVEVMNFGVSSASTGSELVTWRAVASRYAPDVVLLAFFTGNDLADNSSRLTAGRRLYFDLDGQGRLVQGREPPPTPAITRWLDAHSRLYTWQKVATRRLRGQARIASAGLEAGQRIFERDPSPDVEHAWRLTAALLRQLRSEVAATGARFGLVVIPCAEQVDDALWADLSGRARETGVVLDREAPSRRLAVIAADEGLPLLDLAPAFATAARRGSRTASSSDLYLLGRFHLSDAGHEVVADALHAWGQVLN